MTQKRRVYLRPKKQELDSEGEPLRSSKESLAEYGFDGNEPEFEEVEQKDSERHLQYPTKDGIITAGPPNIRPGDEKEFVRTYDDSTEEPSYTNAQKLGLALVGLLGPVIGGHLEGRKGAYAGVSASAKGIGEAIGKDYDNYEKIKQQKHLNKSRLLTAAELERMGVSKETLRDKVKWSWIESTDDKGNPLFIPVDRVSGEAYPDRAIRGPFKSEIYKNTPQSGTNNPPKSPAPAPKTAPAPDKAAPEGVPTELPKVTKGQKSAPIAPSSVVEEDLPAQGGNEPIVSLPEAKATAEFRLNKAEEEIDAELAANEEDLFTGIRQGESPNGSEQRQKAAQKKAADLRKQKADIGKLRAQIQARKEEKEYSTNAAKDLRKWQHELDLIRDKEKAKLRPSSSPEPTEKEKRDRLNQAGQKYDVESRKPREALASADETQKLAEMAKTNPRAAGALLGKLARAAGEVGVLSDQDIQRLGGSEALQERLERFIQKSTTDQKITDDDIKYAQELANVMRAGTKQRLDQIAADHVNRYRSIYGGDEGQVYKAITGRDKPSDDEMSQYVQGNLDVQKELLKAPHGERVEQDGKIFKWNPQTGKYELEGGK